MQKYDNIKALKSNEFRPLTGVSKSVFQIMVTAVKTAEFKRMKRGGKAAKIIPKIART